MSTRAARTRRPPLPLRLVRARPRLFGAIAVGLAMILALGLLAPDWRGVTRLLVGWDVAAALYLALAFHMMASSDIHRIRRRAAQQDEGRVIMLALTVAAPVASLVAIFAELGTTASGHPAGHILVAGATTVLSWALIHTVFALHYAHEFYDLEGGGLSFPGGDPEPDYWDFVYFSFVIGMTSQVSDVGITSKSLRRTATVHGVVAFLFNAALLALTVNLAAGAI
jgi:uncharacterized membrane protein